jgi:hypothetical protein
MPNNQLPHAPWRTSSYTGQQGECVELRHQSGEVAVRDTKDRQGPVLTFAREAFAELIVNAKAGKPAFRL